MLCGLVPKRGKYACENSPKRDHHHWKLVWNQKNGPRSIAIVSTFGKVLNSTQNFC